MRRSRVVEPFVTKESYVSKMCETNDHAEDHDHDHPHDHDHSHDHDHASGHHHRLPDVTGAVDLSYSDGDLDESALSRRRFLQSVGLLSAVGASTLAIGGPVAAQSGSTTATNDAKYQWLAGDHHIHTQYSSDALYTVAQHVAKATNFGIDWMVITDHGAVAHEKVSIARTNSDILRARAAFKNTLIYQGLEWNIPGAEHGTVFFPPTSDEVLYLDLFEWTFDGAILRPDNPKENSRFLEGKAVDGLRWMAEQVRAKRLPAALFLANHPARRGVDSPHEIRNWSDAAPGIAVGMEGAPGHQAAGIAKSALGPEAARGFYDNTPSADSFPGYPPESYRTHGGFDWMTAKVGGLWDSLLAEGRSWWITANSDSHSVYRDGFVRGAGNGKYADPTSPYFGAYGDPVDSGAPQPGQGDYWPGFYSRTVVGSDKRDYVSVMNAISAGRMWVMHGDLIKALDVRVAGSTSASGGVTLGGRYSINKGENVTISINITLASAQNNNGEVPKLARVDLISGEITGVTRDRDTLSTNASVVKSFDVSSLKGEAKLTYTFSNVTQPFYVRVRGTDGRASAPGSIEPRLDPVPVDPWTDLWFYANPIFVTIR